MKFWQSYNSQDESQDLENSQMSSKSNSDDDSSGLLSKTFGSIKDKIKNKANNLAGITNKMNEAQQAMQNWKEFAAFFGIGVFLIFISLTFLPIIAFAPAKFATLFSLGCLSIITSLVIIKGTKKFLESVMKKEKIMYSIAYFATLLGTLFFSLIKPSYIFVLVCCGLQVASLCFLLASNFPGGTQGMKFIFEKSFSCFWSVIKSCFKSKEKNSFLPI